MSNSKLISLTKISPNKTSGRNHAIDTISVHCMAGNLSIETCGDLFAKSSTKASSNYGIGTDGRIALYVDEKDRSWCTSNAANDNRAITIEVANDGGAPEWHCSSKAISSLINLLVDVCQRNNIKKLVWSTNKTDRVNHKNGCNMTVHRDYANKSCPGEYLYNMHGYIAEEVNKKLGGVVVPVAYNDKYTVAKGDTLSAIGKNTGIDWKEIAKANGIKSPYKLSVGQVLSLPGIKPPTAYKFIVNTSASALNVRSGAGMEYKVVKTLKKGSQNSITEEKNGFGKLEDGSGWVSLKFVKKI